MTSSDVAAMQCRYNLTQAQLKISWENPWEIHDHWEWNGNTMRTK